MAVYFNAAKVMIIFLMATFFKQMRVKRLQNESDEFDSAYSSIGDVAQESKWIKPIV